MKIPKQVTQCTLDFISILHDNVLHAIQRLQKWLNLWPSGWIHIWRQYLSQKKKTLENFACTKIFRISYHSSWANQLLPSKSILFKNLSINWDLWMLRYDYFFVVKTRLSSLKRINCFKRLFECIWITWIFLKITSKPPFSKIFSDTAFFYQKKLFVVGNPKGFVSVNRTLQCLENDLKMDLGYLQALGLLRVSRWKISVCLCSGDVVMSWAGV